MKISRLALVVGAGAAVMLAASAAFAHHSNLMFDNDKVVTVQGTVKEFQYTQPHAWIQVLADSNGTQVEWSVETSSPSVLQRVGIRKSSLRPGENVTIQFHPLKDGRLGGLFISVTKENGTVLTLAPAAATLGVTK